MIEVFMQEKQPVVTASTTVPAPPSSPLPSKTNPVPQMSPGSSDNQSSSPQPAQQKLKQQKKKASLTSKVRVDGGGRRHFVVLELQKNSFGLVREGLGLAFLLLALGVCGGDGEKSFPAWVEQCNSEDSSL